MKLWETVCYIGVGLAAVYMLGDQVRSCQTDEVIKSLQSAGIAQMELTRKTFEKGMDELAATCSDELEAVEDNSLYYRIALDECLGPQGPAQ